MRIEEITEIARRIVADMPREIEVEDLIWLFISLLNAFGLDEDDYVPFVDAFSETLLQDWEPVH